MDKWWWCYSTTNGRCQKNVSPDPPFFQISTVPSSGENDLFYALKGAGSSYGVVTNFVYRVHPRPETKAVLVFLFVTSHRDFAKLQKISDRGRYMVSAYRIQRFRKLGGGLDNIVSTACDYDPMESVVFTF